MPEKEYGFTVGKSLMKLFKTNETRGGYYMIFRVPTIPVYISMHPPQDKYTEYHAHVKVGNEKEYDLNLNQDIFDEDYLRNWVYSYTDFLEQSYEPYLDDSRFLIVPSSVIDSLSEPRRKFNVDLGSLVNASWKVIEAEKIPDIISSSKSTVAGISLDGNNSVLVADRKDGMALFSLDKLQQAISIDPFAGTLQPNLSRAFQYVQLKHPEALERWIPPTFQADMKGLVHDIMRRIDGS